MAQLLAGTARETRPVTQAIDALQLVEVDAHKMATYFVHDVGLFTPGDPRCRTEEQPLILTDVGDRVRAQFQASADTLTRSRAARAALLVWGDLNLDSSFFELPEMLSQPHCWFYGHHFALTELEAAAEDLARQNQSSESAPARTFRSCWPPAASP